VSKCIEALGASWHSHLMTRLALRARAGVISLIYRKCLWLSGFGDSESTTGKVRVRRSDSTPRHARMLRLSASVLPHLVG
jgi:hypothetical protein